MVAFTLQLNAASDETSAGQIWRKQSLSFKPAAVYCGFEAKCQRIEEVISRRLIAPLNEYYVISDFQLRTRLG